MDKKISSRIRVLNFFMTCAIVLYHCPRLGRDSALGAADAATTAFLHSVANQGGYLAMSFFFAVTGFLLFNGLDKTTYPTKLRKRLSSLLVPYLLWQVLVLAVDFVQGQRFQPVDFLKRTFLLLHWPQDGALWYVYAVFLLAALSPLMLPVFRNKRLGWVAVLALMVLNRFSYHRYTLQLTPDWQIWGYGYMGNILYYVPCYLAGCYCGKFQKELSREEALTFLLSAGALAALLEGASPGFFADIALKMLPFAAVFLMPVPQCLENRKIYRLSFLMYALHQPLQADTWDLYLRLVGRFSLPAALCNGVYMALILALDIALAWGIARLLRKFSPKALTLLTGGRG